MAFKSQKHNTGTDYINFALSYLFKQKPLNAVFLNLEAQQTKAVISGTHIYV